LNEYVSVEFLIISKDESGQVKTGKEHRKTQILKTN